jgi:hypothetical protein
MIRKIYKMPTLLTRKAVRVVHQQFGGNAVAMVETDTEKRPYNIHTITHYDEYAAAMLARTPFHSILSLGTFQLCAETHEMSHVISDYFDYPRPLNDYLFGYIDNVLADDHDEQNLMRLFPDYSRYIQILLSSLKWDTPSSIQGSALERDLHTLFLLVRFGVITAGADSDFVRLALPLALSSRRGDRQNTIIAASAIYQYLYEKSEQTIDGHQSWMQANKERKQHQAPITPEDIESILGGAQVLPSANYDALASQADQDAGNAQAMSPGQQAGLDGPPPDDTDTNDEFYVQTCAAKPEVIAELRAFFTRNKYKTIHVPAFEGELGKRRRQAYKDHRRGVERRTRVGLRQVPPWEEVAIFMDISSSTEHMKVPYAQAVVCLLAALEDTYDVKTALIMFNSYHSVVMRFGEQVRKTRIRPMASGGTVLTGALDEALGWSWVARDKYAITITDGDIASWEDECLPKLEQMHQNDIQSILIEIVNDASIKTIQGTAKHNIPPWLIAFASTVDNLPGNMMMQVAQ